MKIGCGVSELWRFGNLPLPLTWPMASTTACTTVQAVISFRSTIIMGKYAYLKWFYISVDTNNGNLTITQSPMTRACRSRCNLLLNRIIRINLNESYLTRRKSDFTDHDPAQVKLQQEANGASHSAWYNRNDNLTRGLTGSVWTMAEDQRTRCEVDASDAEVELGQLEHAHFA